MNKIPSLLFWIGVTCLINLVPVNGLICPEPELISPCSCREVDEGQVKCVGNVITQSDLDRTFKIIRGYNNLGVSDWLNISQVLITLSHQFTHFDLTPLCNTQVSGDFSITMNYGLYSMGGPGWPNQGSIRVPPTLGLYSNSLTDEGMKEALNYFDPKLIHTLDLDNNRLKGSLGDKGVQDVTMKRDFEFLPGLSEFTRLEQLSLHTNIISHLGGGQFAANTRLTELIFDNNNIVSIGKNAFAFNKPTPPQLKNTPLNISLFLNQLDDSSINIVENGLLGFDRPVNLDLKNNNFEFISAANFEQLLKARDTNTVDLGSNPLVCDNRMKWLHDQKDIFQNKVLNARCTNDAEHDVFTTSLIQ